jgi:hypothetical protein
LRETVCRHNRSFATKDSAQSRNNAPEQGCQIFLGATYQNWTESYEMPPEYVYKTAVNYTKTPKSTNNRKYIKVQMSIKYTTFSLHTRPFKVGIPELGFLGMQIYHLATLRLDLAENLHQLKKRLHKICACATCVWQTRKIPARPMCLGSML